MKSIYKYFNISTVTAVFLAIFIAGCNNNSTGITEDPEIEAPTVVATSPENNDTNIERNVVVSITFNETMDAASINSTTLTLKQGSNAVQGAVSYDGTTATFTPDNLLDASVVYTAAISVGAKNSSGVALASKTEWNFTTGGSTETDAPTVTATSPQSDDTGIKRNVAVTITFSEPMDPTTINETTFTLKQGSSAVEGDVSYAGTTTTFTATFTPVNPLNASEVYTAAISVGAKSSKGVALESKTEWSFTTGGSTEALEVVDLGTSGDYVILAKTAINNVPTSAITGDLGLSPAATSFITGFALTDNTGYATSDQVTGRVYAADMAAPTPSNLTTAVENMNHCLQ
ncbi:MAG: Ig-like domain-containing protein [Balneolaceae bacterium]|nr:Ig-like domain-containing protein [Balneolaceae bacterium]